MEENSYRLAGWLAIVQAVLFPVSIVLGLAEAGIAAVFFDVKRPFVGPADILMIAFTAIAIYTLVMFRRLLHERYNYHDLDLLITISIWWAILFQGASLMLGLYLQFAWPVDRLMMAVVYAVFMTAAMVSIGIVDILIAVKLLKVKETFSEYIRGLAYINMVAGICEVTVFLSPLSLILIPVSAVVLALVFFRDQQPVEFV